ncbi:MAG: NYN domain-containing protein [Oligoflexus sp.]
MRAAIFIDGGYVQSQFKQNKIDPDYRDLADYFLEPLRHSIPLDLLRCYYYYCPPYMSQEPTEDEIKRMEVHEEFFRDIESLDRWSMRLGKLQKRWDGKKEVFEQKRVDVLLSVDLVRHAAAGHIQHAVLVAGDSDFIPAVEAAKEHGVTVSLWCGAANTAHRDLIALADEVHIFDWSDFPKNRPAEQKSSAQHSQSANSQQNQSHPTRVRPRRSKKNFHKAQQHGGRKPQENRPPQQPRRSHPERPVAVEPAAKSSWTAKIRRFAGWKG